MCNIKDHLVKEIQVMKEKISTRTSANEKMRKQILLNDQLNKADE